MPVVSHNSDMKPSESKSKYSKGKLAELYQQAVVIDKKIFAEQRSNVLLYAGEHYTKPGSKFWSNVRQATALDNSTKIRITKNHIQKICKGYTNSILNAAPGVWIVPRQERELQHQKAAQLNESVWQYIKACSNSDEKLSEFVHDFVVQGEAICKVFWNPKKGSHVGWTQAVDDQGNPEWDEEPSSENPEGIPKKGHAIFTGALDYERLFSFNLLRDPSCRNMKESPFLAYQKLVSMDEAKALVGYNKEKEKKLQPGITGSDYVVFDANDQRYVETKDMVLLVEWFIRSCDEYPNGWYILSTPQGEILHEMEIPFGVYPIIYEGFDELSSTPRHYSIIKVARPYQSHLNFLASKHVEHAVTLGDDKIVTPMGTKIQQGSLLPGIRQVHASGDFKVLEGRVGEQFVKQMPDTITEMYSACNYAEELEDKPGQLDAYTLLYRSMRDKKRFSKYAEKIERFERKRCEVSLELFKNYADDSALIPAIGRNEIVNIAEFRSSDPLHYRIDVVPQTEDIESKLGKQLQINQLLQFAGSNLDKEDLGKLMRNAPYGNEEQMFDTWTSDYDNATNDILSLDRGEYPEFRSSDNHPYHLKRLETRTAQPDYKFMHPHIKQLYQAKKQEHQQAIAENARQIQLAESGFIPSDGPLSTCDMYVQDPSSPNKTQRARFPQSSLRWLGEKLAQQGWMQQQIMTLSQGQQAQISQMVPPLQQMGGAAAPTQGSTDSLGDLRQPYLSVPQGAQL